jgi:hypothetical protein
MIVVTLPSIDALKNARKTKIMIENFLKQIIFIYIQLTLIE